MLYRSISRLSLVRLTSAAASRTPAQTVVRAKTISVAPRQYRFTWGLNGFVAGIEKTAGSSRCPKRSRCAHKTGTANYDGPQASLQRRFGRGLTVGAVYTLSKSMTTQSNDNGSVDPFNPRPFNYQVASWDRRNVAAVTM